MALITVKGTPIKITGNLPPVGSQAPDFTVTKTDLSDIHLKNYCGKRIILNIFPSLDTKTCASAMLQFNEIAAKYKDILILCISADLPFAQKRFCTAEHLDNIHPVSTFRHPDFGDVYGVTITEGELSGLLARSIIFLDETGKVIYTQLVKEITNEPNYAELLSLLQHQKNTIEH